MTELQQILGVLLLITAIILIGNLAFRWRDRRRAAQRIGHNFESFHAHFADGQIPRTITQNVYEHLQKRIKHVPDFPVLPGDSLYGVYGIVNEDLDDLVLEVAAASALQLALLGEAEICTVADLVQLLVRNSS